MNGLLDAVRREVHEANRNLLQSVDGLSDEQVSLQARPTAPSIAFHLWHCARWADLDAASLTGQPQVWQEQELADKWQLVGFPLGEDDTGTGLADWQASTLLLPPRPALLSYAADAFSAFKVAVGSLMIEDIASGSYAQELLLAQLTHVNRHLGMVEALKGLHGLRGTATR